MDEKLWKLLQEVGYTLALGGLGEHRPRLNGSGVRHPFHGRFHHPVEDDAKAACLAHAESEAGLKANLPTTLRLLGTHQVWGPSDPCNKDHEDEPWLYVGDFGFEGRGASPEAAAWALLKKVRGVDS